KADRPRQTPSRGVTESQVFFRNRSVGLMLPERSTSRIYRYAHRWRSRKTRELLVIGDRQRGG
ncbi:MAG: hypothetical protein ACK5YR_13085, partial [Pirellula sp.]